ncbi:MAG: extracellular solute-binding protein [Clostridia bacterium]|nr:extracellular solute-binding protein [Clostridia bacterium]
MKKLLCLLLLICLALPTMAAIAEEPDTDKLVLYTSAGASEYELIVKAFNEKYPDIKVEIVSGGTGDMAARIRAEKEAPYGDVMMGGGNTIYRSIEDCLEPYRSVEADNLFKEFMPDDDLFTPCYINVNSIIVNKTQLEKLGVTVDGWESLCDPALKGKVSFANPASAGSALEAVVNMLAAMSPTGKVEDGWDYVTRFVENLDGKFASGSSAAYKAVVEGEYPVGICNEDKTISYMKDGADVYAVYAKEGITLRSSNIALMKGGANPKNAKLFIDFVVSKECQTAMEAGVNTRPIRGDVPMTTEGRVKTEDIVQLPYPEVDSNEVKAHFQDVVTSF